MRDTNTNAYRFTDTINTRDADGYTDFNSFTLSVPDAYAHASTDASAASSSEATTKPSRYARIHSAPTPKSVAVHLSERI